MTLLLLLAESSVDADCCAAAVTRASYSGGG